MAKKESITAKDVLKGAAIGGAFMIPIAGLPLALYLARKLYGRKATPEQVKEIERQIGAARIEDVKEGFKNFLGIQENNLYKFIKEHQYMFDLGPESKFPGGDDISGNVEDRRKAAEDFFHTWGQKWPPNVTKDGKALIRKRNDGGEEIYIPPDPSQIPSPKWVIDKKAIKPIDNKRIAITAYRQPPIVTPMRRSSLSSNRINDSFFSKPRGGLWYAEGSSWFDFSHQGYNNGLKMFVHEIFINPEHMIIINTKEKLLEFTQKYGDLDDYAKELISKKVDWYKPKETIEGWMIDWEKVAEDCAGVEFFGEGFNRDGWQQSWDIPSGVIWGKEGLRDSQLLYVYNIKNKKYEPARKLGLYSGRASRAKVPLPEDEPNRHRSKN